MENTEIIMNKLKPIYDAVVNYLSEQGSIKDLCYMSIPLSDLLMYLIDINDIIPSDTVKYLPENRAEFWQVYLTLYSSSLVSYVTAKMNDENKMFRKLITDTISGNSELVKLIDEIRTVFPTSEKTAIAYKVTKCVENIIRYIVSDVITVNSVVIGYQLAYKGIIQKMGLDALSQVAVDNVDDIFEIAKDPLYQKVDCYDLSSGRTYHTAAYNQALQNAAVIPKGIAYTTPDGSKRIVTKFVTQV
jgi:hypothetical protein